jgi:predicted Zn-dependent protease
MKNMEEYEKDFLLFLECGFIAVSQLDDFSARDLFAAAKLLHPENTLLTIADGYVHFTKMQLEEAAKSFEAVLKKEPNNEMAKTFLGLTLSLIPKSMEKGEKMLKETGAHSHDPAVKKLTEDSVAFVDMHLKHHSPPMKGK